MAQLKIVALAGHAHLYGFCSWPGQFEFNSSKELSHERAHKAIY